jgi:hypothetical protein
MSKLKYDKTKFKNDEEYLKFLDDKMKSMLNQIKNTPELLDVFKRLNNR